MKVVGLRSTVDHAVRALRSAASDLHVVVRNGKQGHAAHARRALTQLAAELEAIDEQLKPQAKLARDIAAVLDQIEIDRDNINDVAALVDTTAKALDLAIRRTKTSLPALAEEEIVYLKKLRSMLGGPYEWVTPALSRWLVDRMISLCEMMAMLLEPVRTAGEEKLVEAATDLLEDVRKGPTMQDGR